MYLFSVFNNMFRIINNYFYPQTSPIIKQISQSNIEYNNVTTENNIIKKLQYDNYLVPEILNKNNRSNSIMSDLSCTSFDTKLKFD